MSSPVVAVDQGRSSSVQLVPGPILLLGAPGVGKGTQSEQLVKLWAIPHISTGNLLRANVATGTELGLAADVQMKLGKLVPDSVVEGMVAARLREPDTARGYILDGFPRTLGQADWLDQEWSRSSASNSSALPVIAVSIQVDYNRLLRRITGRRTCPVCSSVYNVFLNPSKRDGICDLEGAALVQRADDTEKVFKERMVAYSAETAPVVEHYRTLGRFAEVDGDQPIEVVAAGIIAAVERLRTIA